MRSIYFPEGYNFLVSGRAISLPVTSKMSTETIPGRLSLNETNELLEKGLGNARIFSADKGDVIPVTVLSAAVSTSAVHTLSCPFSSLVHMGLTIPFCTERLL